MNRLEALQHPVIWCILAVALATFWWLAELLLTDSREPDWLTRANQALPTLQVMAGIQPLLGLLGTIIGLLETFARMSVSGGLDPTQLVSGGIAVAMLTTQAGLLMAIPSLIGMFMLAERIRKATAGSGELAFRSED